MLDRDGQQRAIEKVLLVSEKEEYGGKEKKRCYGQCTRQKEKQTSTGMGPGWNTEINAPKYFINVKH